MEPTAEAQLLKQLAEIVGDHERRIRWVEKWVTYTMGAIALGMVILHYAGLMGK